LPSSKLWNSIAYGNGRYVATCLNSSVFATSTDGINWTSNTALWGLWSGITYGNGVFTVVGNGTTALTSSDGLSWTQRTISNNNWSSITFRN
jgi:hypothetical protein